MKILWKHLVAKKLDMAQSGKGGFTFLYNSCDFAAKTMVALAKHNRNEHALSFTTKFAVFSSPFPKH